MRAFSYHRPDTIDEAVTLLAEYGDEGKIIAGGQSLVPMMAMRLSSPAHLIDIARIAGHDRIEEDPSAVDHVRIGARARHAQLEQSALAAIALPLAVAAAPHIGHRAIRNRGTICGSLAHADPAAELPAVALALDAELELVSARGTRTVHARDFFVGYLTTAIEDDEMLAMTRVHKASLTTGTSVQEISRRHGDFALVGVCTSLDLALDGTINSAAICSFGVASTPLRFPDAEALLMGNIPSADAFNNSAAVVRQQLDPVGDNHASAAYRRHVAGVLVVRSLNEAAQRARSSFPDSSSKATPSTSAQPKATHSKTAGSKTTGSKTTGTQQAPSKKAAPTAHARKDNQ